MLDTRIILSGIWIAVMFIYVMGDILRIFSGDIARLQGMPSGNQWLGAAIMMLIPILMILFSLVLPYAINRGANIFVAVAFFLFVLVDMRSYPGAYDKFLLAVSMILNVVTIGVAWNWEG